MKKIKLKHPKRIKGNGVPMRCIDVRTSPEARDKVMEISKKPMNGSKFFHGGYHREKKVI